MEHQAANSIILNSDNTGSFLGPIASAYAYKPELRKRLDKVFEAAKRSNNRYFVLEGSVVRAAQSKLTSAREYMTDDRVLVQVDLEPEMTWDEFVAYDEFAS